MALIVVCVARYIAILTAVCGIALGQSAADHNARRETLNRYCFGCHNSNLKSGGLAIDSLDPAHVDRQSDTWERVVRRLTARSMPPTGLPRPDESGYRTLLSAIETDLDRAAAANLNPGRTDTFRRLTRAEYRNAVRDLLAIDTDVTALLPSDESSHGFDNVTVGNLSPALLERYLAAAEKLSRLALGHAGRAPGGDTTYTPPDLTQENHFSEMPFGTRGGLLVRRNFPVGAEYEIQIRLTRDRNEHVEGLNEPHEIELLIDGERVRLFTVRPPPSGTDHQRVEKELNVRIPVGAGPHAIAATFIKKTSALLETERQPYQVHFNMDRHPRPQPAVYSITINGPFNAKGAGDSPSRRRILLCTPSSAAEEEPCAQKILQTLARRAYRRPVSAAEISGPLRFFREARESGGFETGIEMALCAVLVSPEFLFRVEQDPAGIAPKKAYRISDLELASRLSFFLWSSIPDDALLDTAASGRLKNPAELERQVRRMLADSRSSAFIDNFAGQWLQLRNLASINPDMRVYPDFDDNLRQSMRRETELFFESVLREDRSVLDLLRANYSFVDGRLAKHYGIPNVYGSSFRRITFSDDRASFGIRGGLLGQASILTLTSYATRTAPVIRGKWILTNLLGTPPPQQPPTVPALKERSNVGKPVSMRLQMAEHRDNPACSSCHQLMDPAGLSLETYDALGRWRGAEEMRSIDASGSLPDGTKFNGPRELQQALLKHPENFVRTVSEKLLTYALGRGVEEFDAPAVRKVVRDAADRDYRFTSIILGVVGSAPFQMRRSR